MSGMVDGVSKYFLLYHGSNAMHIDGEETLLSLAARAMRMHFAHNGLTTKGMRHDLTRLSDELETFIKTWEEDG